MKTKLIAEIPKGHAFHYYGRPDRVFVKESKGHAVAPENGRVRVSETTLVVPHETKQARETLKTLMSD